MNRRQLDLLIPMLFGLAVVVAVLFWSGGAVAAVAIIGGIVVGIYYTVVRSRMIRDAGQGRERPRNRNRNR